MSNFLLKTEQHNLDRPGCSATIVSSRPKSKNQVSDHGKMLFHRQRMPGTAVITQERGGGQRRYSTVARRSIASRSTNLFLDSRFGSISICSPLVPFYSLLLGFGLGAALRLHRFFYLLTFIGIDQKEIRSS